MIADFFLIALAAAFKNWEIFVVFPLILILLYIGIYHPGSTGKCAHCGVKVKRSSLVCPNCKKRFYK